MDTQTRRPDRRRAGWLAAAPLMGLLVALAVVGCNVGRQASVSSPTWVGPTYYSASSGSASGGVKTQIAAVSPSPSPTPVPTVTSAGPMSAGRSVFAAVTLTDGRVLLAGGSASNCVSCGGPEAGKATAELFDPNTGKFHPTGPMGVVREGHTTTLLADGRVLVTGSVDLQTGASAEIYDPTTGKFSPTGSMAQARSYSTATRLQDGRVLVAGGFVPSGALSSAEIYDPTTGKFTTTGSLNDARGFAAAALLGDGKVLVMGGSRSLGSSTTTDSAELYDPATGTFARTGSLGQERATHTATKLTDGRVLVTGGYQRSGFLDSAELYDPATGLFSPTAPMTASRGGHTATLLLDGRVLVVGGYDGRTSLASAEIYDPATGKFSATVESSQGRQCHAAALLVDGTVLVAGGWLQATPENANGNIPSLASAEIYRV